MLLPVETIHTDNGRIEWNIITYIKNAQRINSDFSEMITFIPKEFDTQQLL